MGCVRKRRVFAGVLVESWDLGWLWVVSGFASRLAAKTGLLGAINMKGVVIFKAAQRRVPVVWTKY